MDNSKGVWIEVYRIPDNSAADKGMYSMWGVYAGNGKLLPYKCKNLACQVTLEVNFPRYEKVLDKMHEGVKEGWKCPLCLAKIEA